MKVGECKLEIALDLAAATFLQLAGSFDVRVLNGLEPWTAGKKFPIFLFTLREDDTMLRNFGSSANYCTPFKSSHILSFSRST